MAPVPRHFDYLVLGGGSGGVASSRRAARNGAKVMLVEGKHLGGTCVNVGCVPKKVMWNASDLAAKVRMARGYGFDIPENVKFDWGSLKKKRDAYIERLRGIYQRNLEKEGVEYVYGWAQFVDKKTVRVKLNAGGEEVYTADHILVASGGKPNIPSEPKGADYGVTSDGFFDIETQPKAVAIVGAGYIGVEFAGVFNSLGTETHMLIRGDKVLRKFDDVVSDNVTNSYIKHGVNIHKNFEFNGEIEKLQNGRLRLNIKSDGKPVLLEVDSLIWTVGRSPLVDEMGLDKAGIKIDDKTGLVQVDEYQNTNVEGIYSLGDVAEEVALTPAAIAAGRKLSERLFGNQPDAKLVYENIPTAIFSHPEVGTVGLSEQAARKKFGDDNIKVYRSRFINMLYSPLEQDQKESTEYKIVCEGPNEKVVGLHMFGDGSSEILQGFGVAIKMGATKADFDKCVAIHPTAAEELVTM